MSDRCPSTPESRFRFVTVEVYRPRKTVGIMKISEADLDLIGRSVMTCQAKRYGPNERNQCDGCARGLPVRKGMHYNE